MVRREVGKVPALWEMDLRPIMVVGGVIAYQAEDG